MITESIPNVQSGIGAKRTSRSVEQVSGVVTADSKSFKETAAINTHCGKTKAKHMDSSLNSYP